MLNIIPSKDALGAEICTVADSEEAEKHKQTNSNNRKVHKVKIKNKRNTWCLRGHDSIHNQLRYKKGFSSIEKSCPVKSEEQV